MATDTKFLSESRADLRDIFRSAVKAVSPNEIVRRRVKLQGNALYVDERSFPLKGDVYLVGFGKAVMGMAVELERVLGDTLKKGIVSVPSMSRDAMWTFEDKSSFPKLHNSRIDYREGGINNQPDDRSLDTTHDIVDLVEKLTKMDTLIVLVSGGGSALLYMPRPVLAQEDKLELCKKLQNAGADITELNTVRQKLSLVKGGGLARMAYPASVITLILSDIVGDPVDLIASGPTVYNPRTPEPVVAILKRYNLFQSLEGNLKTVITSKESFDDKPLLNPVTAKTATKQFKHVTNIILGNNTVALEAAKLEALRKKLTPIILKNNVTGNVQDVSSAYVHLTSLICLVLLNELERKEFYDKVRTMPILSLSIDKIDEIFHHLIGNLNGIVLIGGGEPTVVVTGQGKGGRNQELALRFSLDWLAKIKTYPRLIEYDVMMLSAGTDGQDGPTDAAGAFGYPAIAPVMHDFYTKIKSMKTEEQEKVQAKIMTDRKTQDSYRRQRTNRFAAESNIEQKGRDFSSTIEKSSREDINEHIDHLVLKTMEVERMLPENVLQENDTYNFYSRFKKGADLVKTGKTGTNVMDLHFIYIKKRSCKCEIDSFDKPTYEEDILDVHDLHIDALTIEKYKAACAPLTFDKDEFLQTPPLTTEIKAEKPFLKIIDKNYRYVLY
ncbi:PREDICTED: LOW QUALITY PROTEIN: glycerate kinase [Trachymyrmex septentrionalis]|uniref:LOW QUALITY PROTEIN: glycerate kinase n=1 Tax=Trachymyrmex septentrionalis TaxID=34720 RepID=UPI00084F15C3|nr:PREDICTED: LOW QUALITY PROTEIN: glycerate kinase [Trachymyrmex septentrionalis]